MRSRVLAAAHDVFNDAGLTIGFDNVRLEDLIRVAGVPRSSVYRLWRSKDEFVADLVTEVFSAESTIEAAAPGEIAALLQAVESAKSLASRRALLVEQIDAYTARRLDAITTSARWLASSALLASGSATASASAQSAVQSAVVVALGAVEERDLTRAQDFYSEILRIFEKRMRGDLSVAHLATASNSLIEGVAQRHLARPSLLQSDPESTTRWGFVGAALVGIVESMTEDVPARR